MGFDPNSRATDVGAGLAEHQVGAGSGLRSKFLTAKLFSDEAALIHEANPTDGTIASYETLTQPGGTLMTAGRSKLPFPMTPCITYIQTTLPAPGGQLVQFRVEGYDQFGDFMYEELPPVRIAPGNPNFGAGDPFHRTRIWTSKVFSAVTKLQIKGSGINTGDRVSLGMFWALNNSFVGSCPSFSMTITELTAGATTILKLGATGVSALPSGFGPRDFGAADGNVRVQCRGFTGAGAAVLNRAHEGSTVTWNSSNKMTIAVNTAAGLDAANGDEFVDLVFENVQYVGNKNQGLGAGLRLSPYGYGRQSYTENTGETAFEVLSASIDLVDGYWRHIPIFLVTVATPATVTLSLPHGLAPGVCTTVILDGVTGVTGLQNPPMYTAIVPPSTTANWQITLIINGAGLGAAHTAGDTGITAAASAAIWVPSESTPLQAAGVKGGGAALGGVIVGRSASSGYDFPAADGSIAISSITDTNPAIVTLASPHGMNNGARFAVTISGVAGGGPGTLNAAHKAVALTSTTFQIAVDNSGGGDSGGSAAIQYPGVVNGQKFQGGEPHKIGFDAAWESGANRSLLASPMRCGSAYTAVLDIVASSLSDPAKAHQSLQSKYLFTAHLRSLKGTPERGSANTPSYPGQAG